MSSPLKSSAGRSGDSPVPSEAAPNRAFAGLALVAALTVGGALALAVTLSGLSGTKRWWPMWVYLALGGAALAVWAARVLSTFRELERSQPRLRERRNRFEARLIGTLGHFGAGDLVRAVEEARDLPRKLSDGAASASEALSRLAQQIQSGSIDVASAAEAVHRVASELASGSSEQAASVVEITAAMEQLARTAAQIAESAARQAALAARAETSGEGGAAAVQEAVTGVEQVQQRIADVANRADALGTRSKEIYRVLDLIAEIAQETHILSLNAAIEAAAAGAEGRRFAVVAEEVRRLAQRSQESVESVRNLLDEFSSSIRATVVATEEGGKEAERVLERARAASAAIEQLRAASVETSRVARQISLATQQQNSASDEVVMTLREVNVVVQKMTGGLRSLSNTADRLNALGLEIQLLAQSFHLNSPRSLKHLVEHWSHAIEQVPTPAEKQEVLNQLVREAPFVEMAYFSRLDGTTSLLSFNQHLLDERQRLLAAKVHDIDVRTRPWFKAVARQWRTALVPPYELLQDTGSCFTICTPMRDATGSVRGVLGIDVNITGWTRIGR